MRFFFPALIALSACTAAPLTELPSRADPLPATLPPVKSFSMPPRAIGIGRANTDIARDFLELAFEMESGAEIERFTRFEEPVTIALAGEETALFEADLNHLLKRLRSEAGIRIERIETGSDANIVIETLPRKKLQRTVPYAACFVVPRVKNWEEFRKNRRSGILNWTTLEKRERTTIFIPDDVPPQEARDCLHEEIAQALGPLNDIYRLSDSVYNDDNINTVLTGFDMLILKAYYSNQLKSGMSREDVAARLPRILKMLNPGGETAPESGQEKTPRAWIDAIETALGPRSGQARRLTSARRALAIAKKENWRDNRLGFNLFAQGRLALGFDSETAAESFAQAYSVYVELYGADDIHSAHVALQLAAFALSTGDSETALRFINNSLPAVNRAQNAALLATFLMIKAEALDFEGRHNEATTVRMDSLGWARYGFGSDDEIRDRLREIAALRPVEKKPEV